MEASGQQQADKNMVTESADARKQSPKSTMGRTNNKPLEFHFVPEQDRLETGGRPVLAKLFYRRH